MRGAVANFALGIAGVFRLPARPYPAFFRLGFPRSVVCESVTSGIRPRSGVAPTREMNWFTAAPTSTPRIMRPFHGPPAKSLRPPPRGLKGGVLSWNPATFDDGELGGCLGRRGFRPARWACGPSPICRRRAGETRTGRSRLPETLCRHVEESASPGSPDILAPYCGS